MSNAIGKNIGQYQIIEFVGRGEHSFVYKGFQPAMSRYVAVKLLSPSLARESNAVRQFQRQAEMMAQLQHRNILPIYDSGQEDNLSFVVSRFAEGGTLQEKLERYQQPYDAYRLISPICSALEYIHGQGLVHGNLNSNNILIDDEDQPLLSGIGGFQVGPQSSQGKVYLSPEQAQGGPFDGRSDIYALGVLLYEMLVGRQPEIGVVPSPRLARPDLSSSIEKVILKAMAQYPDQRYQSAKEFDEAYKEALELSEQPVPVSAPVTEEAYSEESEPEIVEYPAPQSDNQRDDRWIFIAIGGLLLVIILCCVTATTMFLLARDRSPEAASNPTVTAKVDTNVYAGPAPTYPILGVLQQGQSARILGVSADGIWWNIVFPSPGEVQGWVPDAAVVTQNVGDVPVIVPTASLPASSPTSIVPSQEPPTLVPTLKPPTLAPATIEPTEELPTLEPAPTDEPGEPYPPVETTDLPPAYPPAATEVFPTTTSEVLPSPTTEILPSETHALLTPISATELPPSQIMPTATLVVDGDDNVGNSLCGLPALIPILLLVGLALPYRAYRIRHR